MAIEVHPEDGTLMVSGEQADLLVLVVLILLRLGLRTGLAVEGQALHLDVLLISDAKGVDEAGKGVWRALKMPEAGIFAPILYAVPAQQLAYFTAIAKGTDVDQPRNLAKSVTVE